MTSAAASLLIWFDPFMPCCSGHEICKQLQFSYPSMFTFHLIIYSLLVNVRTEFSKMHSSAKLDKLSGSVWDVTAENFASHVGVSYAYRKRCNRAWLNADILSAVKGSEAELGSNSWKLPAMS